MVKGVRKLARDHHLQRARGHQGKRVGPRHHGAKEIARGIVDDAAGEQAQGGEREDAEEPRARGQHGAVEVRAQPAAIALLGDEPLQPESYTRHGSAPFHACAIRR